MPLTSSRHPFEPCLTGLGISRGLAMGQTLILHPKTHEASQRVFHSSEEEGRRLMGALTATARNLRMLIEKTSTEVGAQEAQIFESHLMMLEDEELLDPIKEKIRQNCLAETAIHDGFAGPIEVFSSSDSEILRERVADLKDLKRQLLEALDADGENRSTLSIPREPRIVVARELTPSQTLLLNRKNILGIITERGGETAHSAIIARAIGIPAISGIDGALDLLQGGLTLAMDGEEGSVFKVDSDSKNHYFEDQVRLLQTKVKDLESYRGKPSRSHDHQTLQLMANIGGLEDAREALAGDAEGIGLFRTEFLFMGRSTPPTLDEQKACYAEVLQMNSKAEVVIRTLDIGGDKPIDYLPLPREENPFLGLRAIRYCLQNRELFETQIRALLLANRHGNLSILIPMISHADEMRQVHELIHTCHQDLLRTPEYLGLQYRLGAMLEIPSLAFELAELKPWAEFISVGTNDLLQYFLAVDRMNPDLKALYHPHHPGFLRFMAFIAAESKKQGLEAGICGEIGGSDRLLPLWFSMGFTKLSMTPREVLGRRRTLSQLSAPTCQALLDEVLSCPHAAEVLWRLEAFQRQYA